LLEGFKKAYKVIYADDRDHRFTFFASFTGAGRRRGRFQYGLLHEGQTAAA